MENQIHEILDKYWGYKKFRPLQKEIIFSVLNGNDTLALLPTGGGKSICFQVPAIYLEGVCIVVTPLIALMRDQVENLKKRGIIASAIYSGMSFREMDIILDNCIYGKTKFLYVSPERLKTPLFLERIASMKIGLLAIDEAHCISQWGYDFRPPYLEINEFRKQIPSVTCIALTASATSKVCDDIGEKLDFKNSNTFRKSFARENLSYSVFYSENKESKLLSILKSVPGTSVVYVRNRKKTKEISDFLNKNQLQADFYHAGLSSIEREKKQLNWINNKIRIIVSTNAFGMGIDKPDVRTVIHLDIPESLEAYYQEAGRAGRDEKKAYAVVLYNDPDIENLKKNTELSNPAFKEISNTYQQIANYTKTPINSGEFSSYDFVFEEFIKDFSLNKHTTFHCIKKLEDFGFIQMNEAYKLPSKLKIEVSNRELYNFQVANESYDMLIKSILRIYGGELFSNFITIKEQLIAEKLNLTKKNITESLENLHKLGIVSYFPQSNTPTITYLTPREDAKYLPIDLKKLAFIKHSAQEKLASIIYYIQNEERCRTQLILEYFNELSDVQCNVCDNCIARRKRYESNLKFKESKEIIINKVNQESIKLKDLFGYLKGYSSQEISDTVQLLLDSEEIYYTKDGELKKKN